MPPLRTYAIPRPGRPLRWLLMLVAVWLGAACGGEYVHRIRQRAAHRVSAYLQRSSPQRQQARRAWDEEVRALDARRLTLRHSGDRARARKTLEDSIGETLAPAWVGTPYAFSGKATAPHDGPVACGHYVGAVLRGAGFRVSRDVGALASARIVRSFAGHGRTRWWSGKTRAQLVRGVRREGDGLYLIGLDTHVGLLRVHGGEVTLCHSTGRWPRTVVCEPALASRSLISKVHVWGPLLPDETVDRWLAGQRIPLSP